MKNFESYNKRKRNYEALTIIGYAILIIGFILFFPLGQSGDNQLLPIVIIIFLLGAMMATFSQKNFKKLSNEFKTEFLPNEIQKIYPDSHFDVQAGFNKDLIYQSRLLKKADRYYSEDLITGKYEDVHFRSADIKLQDVRSNGKTTTVITIFLGRAYEFSFNKRFKSNIVVCQPSLLQHLTWNRIKTESVEFNSELAVFSDNEEEAFYILTPQFMERLYNLDRKYNNKITFSFINNKLYIAINTKKDTFDLKMFQPIDQSIIDEYKQQLTDIKDFVHELNLDKKLFID